MWNNMESASTLFPSNSTPPISNVFISYFGRLNYNYKNKYLATATLRADGAGVFADNNKWGTFPSAAIGWDIAEESFFKENSGLSTVIDQLKLRASYGRTGNASINSNAFAAYFSFPAWLSGSDTRLICVA
ncbi:MAG: TonB-dependent receptor, partial [Bacillales bacterium]